MKGLLAVVLVGLLFFSSLGYVAKRLQDPQFLVERTEQANLYGRITNQLTDVLPKDFVKQFPITNDEFIEVVKVAVPSQDFYRFLGVYSGAYLNYWTRQSETIDINYSLKEVKSRASSSLADKINKKYDKLPVCSVDQARRWDISAEFPSCRLAEGSISRESIEVQIKNLVNNAVASLPDNVAVSGISEKQQANRNLISTINSATKIIWIATLLIVVLMVAIWRQRSFMALAIALLFVGLVQIGFSLVAWDWIAENIGDAIAGSGNGNLAPLGLDAIAAAIEILKRTLDNLTIIILGSGGALLVLGIIAAIRGRQTINLAK